jgi:hypothetical protein
VLSLDESHIEFSVHDTGAVKKALRPGLCPASRTAKGAVAVREPLAQMAK